MLNVVMLSVVTLSVIRLSAIVHPVMLANIGLGWKWLTVTDTLAYSESDLTTAVKILEYNLPAYPLYQEPTRAPWPTTNIRLDWKGLPGTNTLAYFENP